MNIYAIEHEGYWIYPISALSRAKECYAEYGTATLYKVIGNVVPTPQVIREQGIILKQKDMPTYYTTDFGGIQVDYPTIDVTCPSIKHRVLYQLDKQNFVIPDNVDYEQLLGQLVHNDFIPYFWGEADKIAKEVWNDQNVKVYSAGRCGKHLIVAGIPLEPTVKWYRFITKIEALFNYCTNPVVLANAIIQLIEDN